VKINPPLLHSKEKLPVSLLETEEHPFTVPLKGEIFHHHFLPGKGKLCCPQHLRISVGL